MSVGSPQIRFAWLAVLVTFASVVGWSFPGVASAAIPGSELWVNRYNGAANESDYPTALGVSPDGSEVFVTGPSTGSTSGEDYATVGYNASTGAQLWVKRYNDAANETDYPTALGVSPDGSEVFVTGASIGSTSSNDYATVAYDASTGAKLWVTRYNGLANGSDGAGGLGVSPDGSEVFVTGSSDGSTSGEDYATVAYDASTGAQLWVKRYNGPGKGYDSAGPVGVGPGGHRVFVTGSSTGSGTHNDYATVAYDASTGAQLWVKRYNGYAHREDAANALGVSADGSEVYVTGISAGSTSGYDYATVGYDASTGAKLWVKRYNGPANRVDAARAVGVGPGGHRVFVTGLSRGSGTHYDYATVAYEASTGARLWVKRYDGPGGGNDDALALGVSPDGSEVFVTGNSTGSTSGGDYATVAYDTYTGAKLWVTRYNGLANGGDGASALGVSPNGSEVFVTGASFGSTSSYDYATVAYGIT